MSDRARLGFVAFGISFSIFLLFGIGVFIFAARSSSVKHAEIAGSGKNTPAVHDQDHDKTYGGYESVEGAYKRIAGASLNGEKAKTAPEGTYGLGTDGKWHLLKKTK
ncbi:MAG TPA: hypothetical protein VK395_01010 [Gemmataceae bacterium]|nr:hypothetical protein [Gemmataceae bacterium]